MNFKKITIIFSIVIVIILLGIVGYFCFRNREDVSSIKEDEVFGNYSFSEWEVLIKNFYDTLGDYVPDEINVFRNEKGIVVAEIYTMENKVDEYVFDNESYIAVNSYGMAVNFINGETVDSKVIFYENECLAIGYVLNEDFEKFKEKYLYITDSIEEFDYRDIYTKGTDQGNRFVIIPKSDDVLVSVYDCFVNSNYELELDNTLLFEHTGIFSILDDYVEVVPNLCIKFEYNGIEEQFYIQFSGEDGKLYLPEVEKNVKDISLYDGI